MLMDLTFTAIRLGLAVVIAVVAYHVAAVGFRLVGRLFGRDVD